MIKVQNIKSNKTGREIPNQFILTEEGHGALGNFITRKTFQSYDSIIAIITHWNDNVRIELDKNYWDYSPTTGRYRNQFLGENKKETLKNIKLGKYILTNLN